jgi:hypothetical protein
MAWSLVRQGSFDLRDYPDLERYVGGPIRAQPNGAWVSIRPPGSALAAVPIVAPFAVFRRQPFSDATMHQLGKLAAAFSAAGAAVFFLIICQRVAAIGAWQATILFALGTCLCSVGSQALWMHGPAVFWLCCALYFITHPDCKLTAIRVATGFALGCAVLTRPTTSFFFFATVGTFIAQRRWSAVLWLIVGGVIPGAILFHYNWIHFGHPFLGGYEDDNWAESTPLWLGLTGLLVAPSRGLLVYSPALLLGVYGAWMLIRQRGEPYASVRGILLAWLLAAGATLLFFARWHDWRGGWCYGPRFLCETMPVLCLLYAVAYAELRKQWQRGIAQGLVVLSVSIHVIGIFGYSGYEAWQIRHSLPDQGRCLFSLEDTQIEAHTRALIKKLTAR